MRLSLTRFALPLLAAALLANIPLPQAHAEPPSGEEQRCGSSTQILPDVFLTTCTRFSWWTYYEGWGYQAVVYVNNHSGHTVTVRPDLLVGPTTYQGITFVIEPGATREALGNMVEKPPREQSKTGRGYLMVGSWTTYTYAPSYP